MNTLVIGLGKFQIPFLILAIGLLINATIILMELIIISFFITCLGYYLFLIDVLRQKI